MNTAEVDEKIDDLIAEVAEICEGQENDIVVSALLSIVAQTIEDGTENEDDRKRAVAMVFVGLSEVLGLAGEFGLAAEIPAGNA